MLSVLTEVALRREFPHIDWHEPVIVTTVASSLWVCRFCIAMYGVKAADLRAGKVAFAFAELEDARAHIANEHGD